MQPYEPLFPPGSAQAQLDQLDRRFAWFRRLLRGVDLRFDGVFPKHWRVQHRLCMRFLACTRAALVEILEGGSKEAEDVTVLLKVKHDSEITVSKRYVFIAAPLPSLLRNVVLSFGHQCDWLGAFWLQNMRIDF